MSVIQSQAISLLLPLLLPVLVLQACFDINHVDPGAIAPIAPPHLIAPLSTATVTSQRPKLRWALPSGTDGAHVQICRDRACGNIVAEFDAAGPSGVPAVNLPVGVLFWRAWGRRSAETGKDVGPTWQFTVGARSAAVDASWGATPDVNGDGFADVFGEDSDAAFSYLYLGNATGLATTPSTIVQGAVTTLGDVNGDGFADILAAGDTLYLGSATGLSATPSAILAIRGRYEYSAIASAGDVNGDGYADVITATSGDDVSAGSLYIYLGSATGLPPTPSTTVDAPAAPDGAPTPSLAGVGDVNGDGYADIVVVASSMDTRLANVYVYDGSAAGLTMPSATFVVPDGIVDSLAGAGDVNGDGYADVILGSTSSADGAVPTDYYPGAAFVYLGSAAGLSIQPSATLIGIDGKQVSFGSNQSGFGGTLASAGDVNGDGFADVILGAPDALTTVGLEYVSGRVYVYLGSARGIQTTPSGTLTNPNRESRFAVALAGARDVNGDGYADIVAGSPALTVIAVGSVYIYLGSATGFPATPSVTLIGPDDSRGIEFGFGGFVASARNADAEPTARGSIRWCPG